MDAKIKIPLFIIGSLDLGGSERIAIYLFRRFHEKYSHAQLIVLFGGMPKGFELEKGVILINARSNIGAFVALTRFIGAKRGEVYLFGFSEKINFFLIFSRFLGLIKAKIILRPSTVLSKILVGKKKFRRILASIQYAYADIIVCQSNAIKVDLEKYFHVFIKKIKVIYNPYTRKLPFNVINNEIEDAITGNPYIVCVGHLRPEKGHLRLLKTFELNQTDAKLVIIGEGPERVTLENYIKSHNLIDRVILLGEITNPLGLMSKACGLAIPSYFEGYPNVAIEAAHLGVPLIGFSDCSVLSEVIKDGDNGWIVSPGDFINFEKVLLKLMSRDNQKYPCSWLVDRHNPEAALIKYMKLLSL